MMAALIRWNNTAGGGELVLDAQRRIAQGDPLIADLFVSLHTDAPAAPGDPVPEGVSRPGTWAASFDRAAIKGSKLWMLRHVKPIAKALALAPIFAEEATRWLVTEGRVASVSATAAAVGKLIVITIVVVLNSGDAKTWSIDVPYAV